MACGSEVTELALNKVLFPFNLTLLFFHLNHEQIILPPDCYFLPEDVCIVLYP